MAQKKGEIIVGLDIGTTKICCIVGEVTPDGIDVIGIGTHPSRGLRKGVVINIEATVSSIHKAVEEAELMAGAEISAVYAGIAGGHIRGFNSQGVVAVKDKEVKQGDLERVLDAARAINIPQDREIIHVLPQEYIIDEQDGIREPLGMSGVRLEAKVHIVTAAVSSAQNIVKCCGKTGLSVSDIVLEPLASAEATLADEEKELGVALVDIGGGTTDLAIFSAGAIQHTSVIPLGGNHQPSRHARAGGGSAGAAGAPRAAARDRRPHRRGEEPAARYRGGPAALRRSPGTRGQPRAARRRRFDSGPVPELGQRAVLGGAMDDMNELGARIKVVGVGGG